MIITRTPFRVPLGGGGTDLPSFYKKHGGYIFSATIDKYMYVALNRPPVDKLIRVKYSKSETVSSLDELQHELAREALRHQGITSGIEITSFADLPAGTGMGSSSSYLVGLLKALQELKRAHVPLKDLAEQACHIELDILKKPIGKQDQYLASHGGFVQMDIDREGHVTVTKPRISQDTVDDLEHNCIMFFTHKHHDTVDILQEQSAQAARSESQVEKALQTIKELGKQIQSELEKGNTKNFGKLMDEHWQVKKTMSNKISDPWLDGVYEIALTKGAEGGKIMGSGGGGLFLFYVPGDKPQFKKALEEKGLTELKYRFDFEGAKVLLNIFQQPHEHQS